ncbi:MAG: Ni/Fe hydrogenase subunit alpha [Coriobacteriia bacterium]|nr:Ni/Fe hydrogenase subunit alpha [Coriobacteriia bacterium]
MTTLSVNHVARIEGHGDITVDVDEGVIKRITMDIVEPARIFESMVVGRTFDEAPLITSRICGICSANHAVTSILATENAFGIEVSERTKKLRELLVYGSYLQNHGTHLYILAAPDYVGLPSVFPLAETAPEIVKRALALKRLGNELCTLVGGRAVHPTTAVIGGFTSEPTRTELLSFGKRLEEAVRDAAATVELFGSFDIPRYETKSDMLSLVASDNYAIVEGEIHSLTHKWNRPVSDYRALMQEEVVSHSNSKHVMVDGKPFMTGAIARVNNSWDQLLPSARVVASKVGMRPVMKNPFYNNICQAIELVDAAERCAMLCYELADSNGSASPVEFKPRKAVGYGATEAPRGTLYHTLEYDRNGIVTAGDVITPTAQNLASLEADMRAFAPSILSLEHDEFILKIEQLVRAYDPCLSCAVH